MCKRRSLTVTTQSASGSSHVCRQIARYGKLPMALANQAARRPPIPCCAQPRRAQRPPEARLCCSPTGDAAKWKPICWERSIFTICSRSAARCSPRMCHLRRRSRSCQSLRPFPAGCSALAVIDYAHTPGALGAALTALQPVTRARGGALVCVFGCGGDRDPGKRPLMGRIAGRLADRLVLTSDNPRCEPPEAIIDDIVKGISEPARIQRFADRARAILQAIRTAAPEDVVLVAGRGHATMQDINRKKVPFSDNDHVRLALDARITGALTAGPDRLTPGKPLKNALGVQGVQR